MNSRTRIKGRYELQEPLGSGAMGDVFRALDTQTGQSVAVKALKSDVLMHDPEMLTRFVREGEALRQLNHPNIVKLLDAAQHEGTHYLVMEYVPGGDLRKLLAESPSGLPLERALSVALDLADALTRAHRLNIIHRDLKPANILVADDGTPRLSDFGIAHFGDSSAITESGAVVGTFAYLCPEACMSLPLDERADIWAFGVVLYEMLAGQRPFDGTSPAAIMMSIMQEKTPDLQIARPQITDQLNDLLYRMLEKNREARIPSVRLVGAELEAIIKGITSTPSRAFKPPAALTDTSIFSTPTPTTTDRPNNLPAQTTPFVGREHELSELTRLLQDPAIRLITILAPGGMGKTRLSLESAEQLLKNVPVGAYRRVPFNQSSLINGAFFVPLAPLSAPDSMVLAVAEAVSFQFYPGGEPKQQLLDFFREKHVLLILDNFEHLLAGTELVSDILAAAPGLKVLATSRERLNLSGETMFNLGGMDFPDWETPADALGYSAVILFMQSAKRVRPDFELEAKDLRYVARICRLVDGMPLGILLAAAWVEMLSLQEIADEIGKSLDFLQSQQRDVPARQRSIKAVFDYSWNLLTDEERAIFRRLSVFRGGFTRDAAQTVAGANLHILMTLVNKSLLRRDVTSGRYEVHELLRQYAQQQLEQSGEAAAARDAHSTYYTDFLAQSYPAMWSKTQKQTIAEVTGEIENIQSAWDWAVEHHHMDSINKALDPLMTVYEALNQFQEGGERFRDAAARLTPASDAEAQLLVARLRVTHGWLVGRLGDYDMMRIAAEESLPLFRQVNSKPDIMVALRNMGHAAGAQGRYAEAQQYGMETLTLAREIGDMPVLYLIIAGIAWGVFLSGRYDDARQLYEQQMQDVDALGVPVIMGAYRLNLGEVLHALREDEAAKTLFEEALAITKDLANRRSTAFLLTSLGNVAHSLGRYEEAQRHFEESLAIHREIGDRPGTADTLNALGGGFWSLGEYAHAQQSHQEALSIYREMSDVRGTANSLALLGMARGALGEFVEAKANFEECLALRRATGNIADIIDAIGHLSRAETNLGNYEAALAMNEQLLDLPEEARAIQAFWGQYHGNRIDSILRMGRYQNALDLLHQMQQRLDLNAAPWFIRQVSFNRMGWAQRELGDLVEAERNIRASLQLAVAAHSPPWQGQNVIQLAALAASQGNPRRAVEMLTCVCADRYILRSDKILAEQYLKPLQAALPPHEFAAAVERGKALTLEDVVQQILDTEPPA